jgi:diguanylate cyclase (GGDEF)-like protein
VTIEDLSTRLRQLDTLVEVTRLINSTLDPQLVRRKAIEAATTLLDAEAASLLLVDDTSDDLFFDVAVGDRGTAVRTQRIPRGQGIGGWVIDHDEPVIVPDASADERFFSRVDENSGFTTRDLIVVPVKTKGMVLGALEGINKKRGHFDDGDLLALYGLANQVALAIENARLYQASITDGLTGLYQRRYFDMRLDDEVSRVNRFSQPLSVMLADIDHFKRINDEDGHPAGDAVLRTVAQIFERSLRVGDVVARYGGEEFGFILPHVDAAGARTVAERLREAVAAEPIEGRDVTISFGVAHCAGEVPDLTPARFVAEADKSLYAAKDAGRNRVELVELG